MKNLESREIWYITGSQHLYGARTLRQVAADSQKIVEELNRSQRLPLKLVFKPTLESVVIDAKTNLRGFKQDLFHNEIYYHLAPGLGRL